ncbi:LAFE_0B04610g1_1 [Lachancea fermentati]|uniref:Topoisomerase I damage affected protein 2 n=1 Tax=Lachancea fermentati TaxID=4955 RepID=A0A1G4M7R4_LACFM|nr:LAFE_0B04610g1_1 [Lachancea fermentati]
MAAYEVNSAIATGEAPVTSSKLSQVIDNCLPDADKPVDLNAFTEAILKQLNAASTLHKFVVSVTRVDAPHGADVDLQIENRIGASWNKEKDGLYTHRAQVGTASYLVTVMWISK